MIFGDKLKPRRCISANFFDGHAARFREHYKPTPDAVVVRWESAQPVRVAEQKAVDTGVPMLDSDHYAIVVYDILTPQRWNLANELKGIAYVRRDAGKTLKPSRVEILRQPDGKATVVYPFPRSKEITKKEGRLEFVAQIGRLFVSQFFYTWQMQIRGTTGALAGRQIRRRARPPEWPALRCASGLA